MSMNNQGYKYDAYAMQTLADITDGPYRAGVAVPSAIEHGKQRGKKSIWLPVAGIVAPEHGKNRQMARAERVLGCYLVTPNADGTVTHFQGKEAAHRARARAHEFMQRMGARRLATYSPEQRAAIEAIKVLKSSIAKLNASLQVMSEAGIPTDNIDTLIVDQRNQIKILQATL